MKKKLIILQEEVSDCGAACLLSILRYYGGNASLEDLRINSLTSHEGVSAYNLIECAKIYGLNGKCIKTNKYKEYKLPYIAHIKINNSLSHFIVIYKIQKDYCLIMDPAKGKTKIKYDELINKMTGYIILFSANKIVHQYKNNSSINNLIINYIKNHKLIILKTIILNIFYLILSIITSFYISILTNTNRYSLIIIIFSIITILKYVIEYIINNNVVKTNNKLACYVNNNYFDHLFKLPLNYIHIKDSGEIIKRIDDLDLINNVIYNSFIIILLNTIILIPSLVILYWLNLYVFLLSFLYILIINITSIFYLKKLNNNLNNILKSSCEYKNTVVDIVNSLNSIYYSGNKKYFNCLIKDKYQKNIKVDELYNIKLNQQNLIKNIINSIYLLIILTYLVLEGKITLVITFLFLINILSDCNEKIVNTYNALYYQNKIRRKIDEFYTIQEEDYQGKKYSHGSITIKNLSFSYMYSKPILKNLNLNINKNEKIIIKGKSGVGKSTLCKIITKELNGYDGNITINNINLKELSINDIRLNIFYSNQNESIINGTIKDNILMGKELNENKLNKIIEICSLSKLLDQKPFGLDTYLFGGGNELSGGEKQLIFIARSLVNDPRILILDETLSEVNEELEQKIINNIFNYLKETTVIYITHKNSTNYRARTIYV